MTVQLHERKKARAMRDLITASVDDIPDYKVKTPLQRAIQLLKRHRDCMFAGDGEHKPISIIITTLAAHAYNEESTISEALQSILRDMANYIEYQGNEVYIANPVNPAENFADKWAEQPKKRENFERWLTQARRDFALYLRVNRFNEVPQQLKEHLGYRLVEKTLETAKPATATTLERTGDEGGRAAAAIEEIRRTGVQSRPWAKL